MRIINYLKERWMIYTFITISFIFTATVYKLDKKFTMSKSNAAYIVVGLVLFFTIFVSIDYGVYNSRIKNFKSYFRNNALFDEDLREFTYPMDREYGKILYDIINEYERFKADIRTQSSEELDFITKWVHDVKVPIGKNIYSILTWQVNLLNNLILMF